VCFTSGGTEADNFAVLGVARTLRASGRTVAVTTPIEHKAILERMVQDFGPNHRLIYTHPDAITPPLGARAPYQGGVLEIAGVGQFNEYKGKRTLAALFTS